MEEGRNQQLLLNPGLVLSADVYRQCFFPTHLMSNMQFLLQVALTGSKITWVILVGKKLFIFIITIMIILAQLLWSR